VGSNFESSLFKELCELVGTYKSHTSPYHPISDDQSERINRTFLQMLQAMAQDNPETWPKRLPALMAAYRMTAHKVTGVTPNFAMFGREVMLPANLIAKPPQEPMEAKVPFVLGFRESLRDAYSRVHAATQRSTRTQKIYYDRRSKCLQFHTGQLVWLYWPKPPICQRFKKLSQLWTGPWKIDHFKSPVVVEIHSTVGKKKRQIVNIDRLVPCSQSTVSTGTDVQSQLDTNSTPVEMDSQAMEVDSQPFMEESQFFQDSTALNSAVSSTLQRPSRKRKLPKYMEDYIV